MMSVIIVLYCLFVKVVVKLMHSFILEKKLVRRQKQLLKT